MDKKMDLSIVISLYNEENSLKELTAGIHKALSGSGLSYEILLIDDGSKDSSWKIIKERSEEHTSELQSPVHKGNLFPPQLRKIRRHLLRL